MSDTKGGGQTCKTCRHCRNGWFEDQRYGCDVECVNGVLIDIDVAHEGWQRDVLYPLAPCHPDFDKPEDEQRNDSQERLLAWACPDLDGECAPCGAQQEDEE